MKLHTDSRVPITDHVSAMVTVISAVTPMTRAERDAMESTLASSYADSADPLTALTMFVRTARAELRANSKTNVLALASGGDSLDRNPHFRNFLAGVQGRSNTDLRTGACAFNIVDTVAEKDREAFTPEHTSIALSLVHALIADMHNEFKGNEDDVSELTMLVSGMLPVLIHTVVEDSSPDMAELPDELLLALYQSALMEGMPRHGVYDMYRLHCEASK